MCRNSVTVKSFVLSVLCLLFEYEQYFDVDICSELYYEKMV
jgi:hypothetical protein